MIMESEFGYLSLTDFAFGQSSSGFGSFGASSSLNFGTTMSGFGAASGSGFGGPNPPGAFWSSPAQTSPFGNMTQPSQATFGNNMFGTSMPIGGSQSAFGNASTPVFGATALRPSAIGTPPSGVIGSQVYGFSFATPTSSATGFSSSAPSFSFPSPHALGQSNSTFGSTPICAASPPLQCFPSGAQATMPTSGNTGFWNSAFGSQRGGSRVATYTETLAPDGNNAKVVKLMSISAMPVFINKSHEEIRHEDYLLGDRGGLTPAGGSGFDISTTQSGPLNPASVYAQTSSSPFNATTSSIIFSPQTPYTSIGFGISSSPFSSSSPPYWPSSTANPFTPSFTFGTSISTPTTSSFTFPVPSSNSTFNFTPTSSIAQTGSAFGQTSTSFWQPQTPCSQTNMYNTPSSGVFTKTNLFAPPSSSPSVFGQMPSPSSTSTYNSGLHNFTPSTPQTGGTFGQTSTVFGQSIFNTPSCGIGSGSSSAAVPTSNAICFNQAAFVDKESDKDMDMDDWVFC